jgi:hypothetical protein
MRGKFGNRHGAMQVGAQVEDRAAHVAGRRTRRRETVCSGSVAGRLASVATVVLLRHRLRSNPSAAASQSSKDFCRCRLFLPEVTYRLASAVASGNPGNMLIFCNVTGMELSWKLLPLGGEMGHRRRRETDRRQRLKDETGGRAASDSKPVRSFPEHMFVFEPLEPRLLLSGDISPIASLAIVNGLHHLDDVLRSLALTPDGGTTVPIVNRSLADLAALGEPVAQLETAAFNYLTNAPVPTIQGLASALNQLSGAAANAAVNGTLETVSVKLTDKLDPAPLVFDLSGSVGGLALSNDPGHTVDLAGSRTAALSFGVDMSAGVFVLTSGELDASLNISGGNLQTGLDFGGVPTTVTDGTAKVDASFEVKLVDPANPDGSVAVTDQELTSTPIGALVQTRAGGQGSLGLDLTGATLPAPEHVDFAWTAPFNPGTASVTYQSNSALSAAIQQQIVFQPNEGQANSAVAFTARDSNYTLDLMKNGAALELIGAGDVLQVNPIGANPNPTIVGLDQQSGAASPIGSDPSHSTVDVPGYGRIQYSDVYPGIDLAFYAHAGAIKYDWIVRPGGDPGAIKLAFTGAAGTELDPQGNLVVHTSHGELIEKASGHGRLRS